VPKIDDEVKEAITPQTVTLVVARETAAVDSEIRFLQWLLAAATGGTIILALLVGAVVVRQGLMPLNDLAARIAAIRQDDLSTQIATDRMPAEMAPVVQRLNDLLRRLEQAFQRERAFTADAAHELRTPLAGVRSTLEVSLSRTRAGEDYRQAMTECLDIVGHMQTMVDNLLALARLEGRQTALRFETLLLGELIEAIWRPMSVTARRRGIAVKTDLPADLACHADRDILAMTLTNLLANASEYTDDGGRIEVIARQQGESVELALANTGCRLSAEDARHVFERFWRADPSRTDTGLHCGLGLVLVQRAVTSLGGTVAAGVADGVFTVRLVLPAARTA
jgi:two-component system heavy metal sensor histidine kinase CusS